MKVNCTTQLIIYGIFGYSIELTFWTPINFWSSSLSMSICTILFPSHAEPIISRCVSNFGISTVTKINQSILRESLKYQRSPTKWIWDEDVFMGRGRGKLPCAGVEWKITSSSIHMARIYGDVEPRLRTFSIHDFIFEDTKKTFWQCC